jgi:glycosyltransferase involved in cell wall biosynthesis
VLNQIFFEALKRYSYFDFELIVIDNGSTDGSAEFFESVGATVVRQNRNSSYSEGMNIGMEKATTDYFCHINNDVIVGVDWDKIILEAMDKFNLDIASPSSIELMPTYTETKFSMRTWKKVSHDLSLTSRESVLKVWQSMYGDWGKFCYSFSKNNNGTLIDAINGHTVMLRRSVIDRLGKLDERMLATDWDLYLTAKERELRVRDIIAPKIVAWSYVHHFMQATAKITNAVYESKTQHLSQMIDKWPLVILEKLWPMPMHIHKAPTWKEQPIKYCKYAAKRIFNLYQWGDDW